MKYITNILNPIDQDTTEYLDKHIMEIEKGKIINISPLTKNTNIKNIKNCLDSFFLPALIDAHTHLPQLPITGSYGETLIGWLNNYAYKSEIQFEKENYARKLSKKFFKLLRSYGTGTAVIYSSIHKSTTDIAFEEAEKSNLRIFMGKTMMDQNSPTELSENTIQSLAESHELVKKWHKKNNKIQYIYSPRFPIATSEKIYNEVSKMSRIHNTFIQTHLNENLEEKALLRKIYPETTSYTEIYYNNRNLGPKTLLAHCIHNTKEELEVIEKTKTNIIHCPEANFFLKSGKFPLKEIEGHNIPIGLGSDVGAGTTLDMFQVMKSVLYTQEETISTNKPFYYATLGNAQILGISDFSGSIEKGKNAEILKISTGKKLTNAQEILNHLIFTQKYKRELIF